MTEIGAPDTEIEYVKKSDGYHFDVNKDGKYDLEDLIHRDW